MSGKIGQVGRFPTEIPEGYHRKGSTKLDGRSRSARELKARRHAFTANPAAYLQASRRDTFLELEIWLRREGAVIAQGEPIGDSTYLGALNAYVGLLRQLEAASRDGHGQDLATSIQAALRKENDR